MCIRDSCKDDLEAHFTEKVIGNMAVDVLDIGAVHFPTGQIFACDPLVELEDTLPFLQTIPAGTYPVKICVVPVSYTHLDVYKRQALTPCSSGILKRLFSIVIL